MSIRERICKNHIANSRRGTLAKWWLYVCRYEKVKATVEAEDYMRY